MTHNFERQKLAELYFWDYDLAIEVLHQYCIFGFWRV